MAVSSSKFRRRSKCWLYGASVLFTLFECFTAEGATYYVSTTGNDSNPGTAKQPWLTIQKCFSSNSPLVAGDVCEVANGTYSSTTSGRVVSITSSSPKGTTEAPITLRAANRLGAIIEAPNSWPSVDCEHSPCPFVGIMISNQQHYVIEGFQFTRPGSYYAAKASSAGITFFGVSNIVVRYNHFHDIGRNVCHNGLMGQVGAFAQSPQNVTYEHNIFNTIGRLRNGENGCETDKFHHDHGVYIENGTDITIRRNIFYDVNRGMAINLKARQEGTRTLRAKIFNNVFSGKSPDNRPDGHLALTDLLDDVQIKNNIFYDPPKGYAIWWAFSSKIAPGPGLVLQNNLTNGTNSENNLTNPYLRPFSGITLTKNLMNTSPGFSNARAHDYRLSIGSAAINSGTNVGLPYSGLAPDIGAFEFSEQNGNSQLRSPELQIH